MRTRAAWRSKRLDKPVMVNRRFPIRYECTVLSNRRYHRRGMPFRPTTAPTMLPAVAAVQSLSMPMATVSPITRVKSVPPIIRPKAVKHALLMAWV